MIRDFVKVKDFDGFNGNVIKGKQLGKQLGFPTANLDATPDLVEGVYYGTCILHDKVENMVMSIGYNPTCGDRSVEVHIYDKTFDDFYGQNINVQVGGYIRKMVKCESLDDLISLIHSDISHAKRQLQ
jgi:riboflavin kinase/FMN adenylyltransferase